jgi:DNA-binding GntR family transcriptional regulator
MNLAPLVKKRATDEVYESLRAAILSRLFVPGQRLLADELSQQLGVSLTPIRHALQQLAVEGLVEIHPRSGTYVASISGSDLEETFEIRLALELLAAQRLIARLKPADARRFRDLLVELAKPVADEAAMKRHEETNLRFHRLLFEVAGSKRLTEMYEGLNAHIQIARIHATESPKFAELRGRLAQEQSEHEAIVVAIEKRDLKKLDSAVRQHIERAKESLVAALSGLGHDQRSAATARRTKDRKSR